MVVRATSDLHLSGPTEDLVFAALGELRADAEATSGHTVIAGDVFDQGVTVHMPTWNRLRDLLHAWPGEVFVIAGNHDQYPGGDNCLRGLACDRVEVVSAPTATIVGPMVPYVRPGSFEMAVQRALEAQRDRFLGVSPRVLWCHQGFKGAYLNSMRRDPDGVSPGAVPAGHITIAGHYHMPQNLGPLVYCGSPYETTFAEEGQGKGWLRWADIDNDAMPARVPFAYGYPRHHTIRWDPAAGPPPTVDSSANDRVRVVTCATRREADAAADQLTKAGLGGVPVIAVADVDGGRGVVDPGADPRTAAEQFAIARFVADAGPGYDPVDMQEFADEETLWAAFS